MRIIILTYLTTHQSFLASILPATLFQKTIRSTKITIKYGNLKTLVYYYAYGIRNSFGLDFDPLTAKLWDTENGEDKYDEYLI